MKVMDITKLLGPEKAGIHFGNLFRGAPYNNKWAIILTKTKPESDWPFTVVEIDGRAFYRPKTGRALTAFKRTEFYKSIKREGTE